jgi:hypothetical protein
MVIFVAVVLGLWLVLTVVTQFHGSAVDWVQRWDTFRLLPKWTFFAPNPGSTDYYLVYREVRGDSISAWRELPFHTSRSPWRWFWYPEKRFSKAITDCTQGILDVARNDRTRVEELLPFTLPYLAILNVVSAIRPADGVDARQFAIVEKDGYLAQGPPRLLVASAFHPLAKALP